MPRFRDLTGKKFGQLHVLTLAPKKKSWTMWNCQCDCGNKITTYSTHLVRGNVLSCGCTRYKPGSEHIQWTGYGEISGQVWNTICHNAGRGRQWKTQRKYRVGLTFDLTIDFVWQLFLTQNRLCALSNIPIFFGKTNTDDRTASLDRIDSQKGYTKTNVQWVHKDINRMKNNFPQKYFVELCKQVAGNN